ncbi:GNAT family N-acetyltransferase [Pseudoalteromonas sp. C2R02]|uniref:GNAT family N-acetyltransferase n=1 Tax=Pseudoalteromonas sp. C2R02 TaxID=2841565 RepID=UPI0020918A2C|nr:GNAT family N-acetyltransferase [Pseudoalteromonas sp. C2R02]
MIIKKIPCQVALPVRHTVLWPDKPVSFCVVEGDENALHFGVFIKGQLVTVASIYIDGTNARLRKFATLPDFQGQGLGSYLIKHIIEILKSKDITLFWCDARKTAISFYQKLGLKQRGKEFDKSGVMYIKMAVYLN